METADVEEAAAMLRRILAAIEAGELDASTAPDAAAVRRIEGALAALETIATR